MAIVQTSLIGTKLPNLGALLTLFDMLGIKTDVSFPNYAAGTMGPASAFDLLEKDGFYLGMATR